MLILRRAFAIAIYCSYVLIRPVYFKSHASFILEMQPPFFGGVSIKFNLDCGMVMILLPILVGRPMTKIRKLNPFKTKIAKTNKVWFVSCWVYKR